MHEPLRTHSVAPRIDPAEVRLDEFLTAFEIAGCFAMKSFVAQSDDLEAIPYGGTE